jgi:predicted GIY-YIG superfamily endonuclease
MVFIYILGLVQNKFYVGKTENPKFRLESHFKNGGCVWTKKYKPTQIIGLFPDCDDFDEDKYTLKYMTKHGIDNVRGGSFCQTNLSN